MAPSENEFDTTGLEYPVIPSMYLSSACTFLLRLRTEVMSEEELMGQQKGETEVKSREFIFNNSPSITRVNVLRIPVSNSKNACTPPNSKSI